MKNINKLLNKYWEAETTLEEEATLKAYFNSSVVAPEHSDLTSLFVGLDELSKVQCSINVAEVLSTADHDMSTLLDKYWEGNTSISEEQELKAYFRSGSIHADHEQYAPLFRMYDDMFEQQSNIDVAKILKEEKDKESTASIAKERKVFRLSQYIPAIAAVFVSLLAVVTIFNLNNNQFNPSTNENVVVLDEKEQQEEAIRVTKEALALLSKNYKKGTEAVAQVKHLEKTNIFSTN